jgi:hypothetical protein
MSLVLSSDDLVAEHVYYQPNIVAGYQLHGGLDKQGQYLSPRSLNRGPAISRWAEELGRRGGELLDCFPLLQRTHYPTVAQQKLLLSAGIEQPLWNSITRSSLVEADGIKVAAMTAPDFGAILDEDLSGTTIGHLNKGLLYAHGLDEGHHGHDLMWKVVRELLFGPEAFPEPPIFFKPKANTAAAVRKIAQIPEEFETFILFLMEVLTFEVLAENFFRFCTAILADSENFPEKRESAKQALDIVEQIRKDETLHVGYLNNVLSEIRNAKVRTVAGAVASGAEIIDPIWNRRIESFISVKRRSGAEWVDTEILNSLKGRHDGESIFLSFKRLAPST